MCSRRDYIIFDLFDLILGAAMALYLIMIWKKCKRLVAEHGWNAECADPLCGIMYYLVAGKIKGSSVLKLPYLITINPFFQDP